MSKEEPGDPSPRSRAFLYRWRTGPTPSPGSLGRTGSFRTRFSASTKVAPFAWSSRDWLGRTIRATGFRIATLSAWPDVTAYSTEQQKQLLLGGMVDRSRRQLGMFRALLIVISTIIMALILYTLTLDKLHDIAMLKLIGARNGVIVGLILQQALLMGALGYGQAWWLGQYAFPRFPRLVIIETPDLLMLGGIVLAISVLASLLGIAKAMRVEPNKVLAG